MQQSPSWGVGSLDWLGGSLAFVEPGCSLLCVFRSATNWLDMLFFTTLDREGLR